MFIVWFNWFARPVKDKKLLEGVQCYTTKLVPELQDLPYKERLSRLMLPELQEARADMIEVYKYTHDIYTINQGLLPQDTESTTRGHPFKLKKRYCRTDRRHNFFGYCVVDSWNSQQALVVTAPSLNNFKNRLDKVWDKHTHICTTNLTFPPPPPD